MSSDICIELVCKPFKQTLYTDTVVNCTRYNLLFSFPVQNVPIPLKFPPESNKQIWGGEGIIQGFLKKHKIYKRRVPHFWFPQLKRSVVYSEVLDKYMSVVVTPRTINLINENFGFDHYLLKVLPHILSYVHV